MGVPDVAEILPGVITPVPLLKTGVKVVELPLKILVLPAVKDVATGAGTTVTVVFVEAVAPIAFVTVKV